MKSHENCFIFAFCKLKRCQAHWSPYVPHVDEWLEEAAEPDEETDSWVARPASVELR